MSEDVPGLVCGVGSALFSFPHMVSLAEEALVPDRRGLHLDFDNVMVFCYIVDLCCPL